MAGNHSHAQQQATLVVLLHAFTKSPRSLDAVKLAAQEKLGNAEFLIPALNASRFSVADPNDLAANVLGQIDRAWDERRRRGGKGFDRIVLVGHSVGALIARKVYVVACGEHDAPFERQFRVAADKPAPERVWASQVERVILLAGMNRGWTISHHLSLVKAIMWSLGTILGAVVRFACGRRLAIMQIRRGAPFITQLRLQWLAMRVAAKEKQGVPGDALTVQLLGTVDDMVSPEDNIDLVTGRDFAYLDVERSGHSNVIDMDDSAAGRGRRKVFQHALTAPATELIATTTAPSDILPKEPDPGVTDVIFVIHGIRDEGYWTQRIARRVKELGAEAKPPRRFATETSSYGYFPMLPFLFSRQRLRRVEWLMNEYTEDRALYPNARFHFVGHSNGTYLLTKALEDYPACRFENVVLAGSVVRTDYPWGARVAEGRVGALLNYVASKDWVVAIFPKSFEMLHWQDLGSAGHDGFAALTEGVPGVEVRYVSGGHGAALAEDHWQAIASFIVQGPECKLVAPPALLESKQTGWVLTLGRLAPIVLIALVGALLGGAFLIGPRKITPEVRKTLWLGAYLTAAWKIVTRL